MAALHAVAAAEEAPPTPAGLRHWIESHPAEAAFRTFVAEAGGELAGFAFARINWTISPGDTAWVWAAVVPPARGRGIGSALADAATTHALSLDPAKLDTFAIADSPGERFARARGFRRTRTELLLALDLEGKEPPAAEPPPGFTLAPLGGVRDRLPELHRVYAAAAADIPADDPEDAVSFADFERHVLGDPELDAEASTVVLHEGRPVSLAFVAFAPEVGVGRNEMTGTLPEFRGRGLARAAKAASVRAAKERGVRALTTENDSTNAAMLRLNRSLGYEARHTQAYLVRDIRPRR